MATIFLTQGRGSHRYESMLPTGSSQKACFLSPHCTHLRRVSSTSSHIEQNCCTQTRFGTCNVALSKISYSRLSQNRRIHYLIAGWQHFFQRSHITQMTYFFIIITVLAISFITFMVFTYHEFSTRTATSLTLAHSFFLCRTYLVIIITILTSKVCITFVTRNSNTFECARKASHACATRLIAVVSSVASTTFAASLTDVLFCHITRQVCNHVIVPLDIIV